MLEKSQLHMLASYRIQVGRHMSHRSSVIQGLYLIKFLMKNNGMNGRIMLLVCGWCPSVAQRFPSCITFVLVHWWF